MKRRVYALVTALAFAAVSLAGCAQSQPKEKEAAPAPSPRPETAAPAPTPAQGDFKLGVVMPFSGVFAGPGEDMWNGFTLYMDEVAYTAGGRKIVVTKEDEEATPEVAMRKVRKLIDSDKVEMVTGLFSSASALAAREVVNEAKIPTVISNAAADALSAELKSPYIVRTSFTNWQIAAVQGPWAAQNLAKRAVIIVPDYQAGKDSAKAFRTAYEKAGGQVVGEVMSPLNTADYGPYLTQIQRLNPEVVYAFFAGADSPRFIKQYNEFGLSTKIKLIANGSVLEEDVLDVVGPAAEGLYSAWSWAYSLDTPASKAFVSKYEGKFKKKPSLFSVHGYEAAQYIVELLNLVKGNTADKAGLLAKMKDVTFTGPRGPFKLDPDTQSAVLTMYIRRVDKSGNAVQNVVIDKIPNWIHAPQK